MYKGLDILACFFLLLSMAECNRSCICFQGIRGEVVRVFGI